MTRSYARAPKGQRACSTVPRNRSGNLTLLAALSRRKLLAEWVIERNVDGDVFVVWLERVLLPRLTPGHTVVMDNLRTHYRKEVRTLIEAHGCTLLYLPPYSPDFSPIELTFSKIKGQLKSLAARTKQALTDAVAQACRTVGSAEVAGWFKHCAAAIAFNSSAIGCIHAEHHPLVRTPDIPLLTARERKARASSIVEDARARRFRERSGRFIQPRVFGDADVGALVGCDRV